MGLNTGTSENMDSRGMGKYISPLGVWGLSLGCAVGWGSFVMPGTTFLPVAGPVGTAVGILLGALVMFIIGMNYHFLMNRYPDAGGTLTYTAKTFGYDHGFLSAWFILLVYVAIIWANATALSLIARNLLGDVLQFGFHYVILGYDVYFGEVLLSIAVVLIFGIVCIKGKHLTVWIQTVLAFVLFAGVIICFAAACRAGLITPRTMSPGFMPEGGNSFRQIFAIMVLAPWAYAGFESVSNSTECFSFSVKKTILILSVSLFCAATCYVLLGLMAAGVQPVGYKGWVDHITHLGEIHGLGGLPTFNTAYQAMGNRGLVVLAMAAAAGIITGLVGNYVAAARLIYSMSKEGMLPEWFGRLNKDGNPSNAFGFLMGISLVIPFLGRTAVSWIVDVNTIGATIAYGYTSASAYVNAKREKLKAYQITGVAGLVISLVFFFYFMAFSSGAMSTEAYMILAAWSILGFIYFRYVFKRDEKRRFGRSTIVWIGLLFLIIFTSVMWSSKANEDLMKDVVVNVGDYYESKGLSMNSDVVKDSEMYLESQLLEVDRLQTRNSMIQMVLNMFSLAIMFSIYTTMSERERKMEIAKAKAEESDRAKTTFLSNMSHDIRTPMNAIIGYINLAEKEDEAGPLKEYLGKIKTSSHHLLALINDVLEMSRIESGKIDLEPIPVDLIKTLNEAYDMFINQMDEKHIAFKLDTAGVKDSRVYCDKNRLNRVLLNLISNSWKFTPDNGTVTLKLTQKRSERDGFGSYELIVSDTGIGMTKEFAKKVFEAFEREDSVRVNNIQGTGLGMAITKSIIDLMGGSIRVQSEQDRGTEFIVDLQLELIGDEEESVNTENAAEDDKPRPVHDFTDMRLLLVEDMDINREIAGMQLGSLGFIVENAVNGLEAVEKIKAAGAGYFDVVLMDIQMPVMNGYEATRQIRSLPDSAKAGVPIIAMTANAFSEDVKNALDSGMNGHIAKPIDVNVMISVLHSVLG